MKQSCFEGVGRDGSLRLRDCWVARGRAMRMGGEACSICISKKRRRFMDPIIAPSVVLMTRVSGTPAVKASASATVLVTAGSSTLRARTKVPPAHGSAKKTAVSLQRTVSFWASEVRRKLVRTVELTRTELP